MTKVEMLLKLDELKTKGHEISLAQGNATILEVVLALVNRLPTEAPETNLQD